jgi:hypothetical protein
MPPGKILRARKVAHNLCKAHQRPHFPQLSIRAAAFSTRFSTELLKTFTKHSSFMHGSRE